MKINSLLESITVASNPNQGNGGQAPNFGRSNKVLEDDTIEETTSGCIASVDSPTGTTQRRGKGSMFAGISTSEKYPNSKAVKEAQLDEVDPRNFDSDEDYYAARNAPAKARSHSRPSPGVNQDDEAYFREIFRKKRLAAQQAERNADHDRLATGTNESVGSDMQVWDVHVFNNFYRGKYADYGPRLYSVVASSPEEARQVVINNPDYVLQDLLSRKLQSGKRVLPRQSALPIEEKRVGKAQPGTITTMALKKMLTPDGVQSFKFTNGKIVDGSHVAGGEQVNEKSKSQAQFRTMAAVAHNPKFAKKVGISPKVGKEFHSADRKQNYKDLPKEVDEAKRGNFDDKSVMWHDEQGNARVYHRGDAGYDDAKKARAAQQSRLAKKGDGKLKEQGVAEEGKGLWANIHAKRDRIKSGSGERMRKPGSKGAPTADALKKSATESVAEEASPLDRVRDRLGDQGYIGTQANRLRGQERNQEWLDRQHDRMMNHFDRSQDSANAYHDSNIAYWNSQADKYKNQNDSSQSSQSSQSQSDPILDRAMNMFIDRMNRHQSRSQRDVDPEQLEKITNIKYKPGEEVEESLGQSVDSKGLTQQQWMQQVKSKFPDARIMQSKMIDGPCQAMLPDGRKLSWNKVEQAVGEARASSASFRQSNSQRAEVNAMSPEERKAHEDKRAEQQRKRDDARMERERQRNAAKKGVAEGFDNQLPQDTLDLIDEYIAKVEPGADRNEMIKHVVDGSIHTSELEYALQEGMYENEEYDDEAGMAESNLHTIARAAQGLIDTIGENENLPEWCQEKIAKVEGMLVAVWDYLESQEAQGIDPQVDEAKFDYTTKDLGNDYAGFPSNHRLKHKFLAKIKPAKQQLYKDKMNNTHDWDSLFALFTVAKQRGDIIEQTVDEDWQKTNKKDKTDGMSPKAVKAYRRENPGSKLKTAVTTKPSKLKPGSKAAKRRKSFCARMSGNKGPMKDEKGRPTPKAKALSRWNCESVEQTVQMLESVQLDLAEMKQRLDPKCWQGYKKQGTKMKGGTRVNNCVKVDEAEFTEDKIAQDLYKDFQIFKKGADKDIGSKAKDKDISSKAKDKDIVAKMNEMDGNGVGRDGSTDAAKKQFTAKPMTSQQAQDKALDTLKKVLSKPENMNVLKRLKNK